MSLRDEYPVKVICTVLECSRSSLYYRAQSQDEGELRAAIERLAGQWVTYGYRASPRCFSVRVGP
jgi:hypothetical protein